MRTLSQLSKEEYAQIGKVIRPYLAWECCDDITGPIVTVTEPELGRKLIIDTLAETFTRVDTDGPPFPIGDFLLRYVREYLESIDVILARPADFHPALFDPAHVDYLMRHMGITEKGVTLSQVYALKSAAIHTLEAVVKLLKADNFEGIEPYFMDGDNLKFETGSADGPHSFKALLHLLQK